MSTLVETEVTCESYRRRVLETCAALSEAVNERPDNLKSAISETKTRGRMGTQPYTRNEVEILEPLSQKS